MWGAEARICTFSWYQAILAIVTGGWSWRRSERREMLAYPHTLNTHKTHINPTWMTANHARRGLVQIYNIYYSKNNKRWSQTCENFYHHCEAPRSFGVAEVEWMLATCWNVTYIDGHFGSDQYLLYLNYICKWFPSHTHNLFTTSVSGILRSCLTRLPLSFPGFLEGFGLFLPFGKSSRLTLRRGIYILER